MIEYIVVDGELNGTGVRDYYEGGYIDPLLLNLSEILRIKQSEWLLRYENEHYHEFSNEHEVEALDKEGLEIAQKIKKELSDRKVHYYSAAKLKTILL